MQNIGNLRGGVGRRYPDRRHLSCGSAAVLGSIPADRMWLRLLQALERSVV